MRVEEDHLVQTTATTLGEKGGKRVMHGGTPVRLTGELDSAPYLTSLLTQTLPGRWSRSLRENDRNRQIVYPPRGLGGPVAYSIYSSPLPTPGTDHCFRSLATCIVRFPK